MEAFLYYCLSIIFILVSFLYIKLKNTSNRPPGTTGWPIIGENIRWASSGPEKFIHERMKMYSNQMFKTSLIGEKMAVICGAEGNKFVFANENKLFSGWVPKSITKPLTFSLPDNTMINHRGYVVELLKPEALKRYVSVMDSAARQQLETDWAPFEHVKVHPLAQKYTFLLACELFLGVQDPTLVQSLWNVYKITVSGLLSVPVDFPGTPYRQAVKGGKMVKDEFLRIIRDRKAKHLRGNDNARGFDLLSKLLLKTDENGCFMSETEIGNSILGLVVASYDTTSSAITFALDYIAQLPEICNKVYQETLKKILCKFGWDKGSSTYVEVQILTCESTEIMEISDNKDPEKLLNWNDIRKMKYSWNVVCEAMRLTSPGLGNFRKVITDFTYAGFTVPKDWKVFWSTHSTNKDPKYFPDPEKFDPSRFEGNGPAPYAFVPFGGGSRICPGKDYARIEILVFVYNVVKRFRLQKVKPDEKVLYVFAPVPEDGLPLRLLSRPN